MGMDVSGSGTPGHALCGDEELRDAAYAWVTKALVSVSENKGDNYTRMLNDLREVDLDDSSKTSALEFRLKALAQSVYYINEQYHQDLLDQVLGMSLWNCNGTIADIILEFVVNLTTANGGCVGQCIDMLVRNFLPPSCGLPQFLDTYSMARMRSGRLTKEKVRAQQSEHLAKTKDILERLHEAIRQITSLVPTTPLRMLPVVLKKMPHRSIPKEWNLLYLENMLRLESSGGRYFASQMLPAVVDLLIQIDVEIKWEDIVKEEPGSSFVFHMDVEEDIEEREPDANEAHETDFQAHPASMRASQIKKLSTVDEMAEKMDAMMDMTLAHLQLCAEQDRSQQVYDTLMKSFQSSILFTHRSKFTQFLIFYLCSLEPNTCGSHFADLLCEIIIARTHSPTTRISAAAYLASYLARGKFLSASVISVSLTRLVTWCISYGGDDITHHDAAVSDAVLGVFFSVCQAVMYTLCFRFRLLNDNVDGKRVLRGLQLQKLANHRLSPLTVCLPSVVEEFLKRARMLQLVDQETCSAVKESVERRSVQNESLGDSRLDMFFPFDPYLLHTSDRFIKPNYISWSSVQSLEENDGSDFGGSDVDSESDGSSDLDIKPRAYSVSPASHVGNFGREDDFEESIARSASLNISRKSFAGEFNYSRAGASPYSDEEFADSFHDSFDAMAITPPHSQKMPAKLPAKLPADFSQSFHR